MIGNNVSDEVCLLFLTLLLFHARRGGGSDCRRMAER